MSTPATSSLATMCSTTTLTHRRDADGWCAVRERLGFVWSEDRSVGRHARVASDVLPSAQGLHVLGASRRKRQRPPSSIMCRLHGSKSHCHDFHRIETSGIHHCH